MKDDVQTGEQQGQFEEEESFSMPSDAPVVAAGSDDIIETEENGTSGADTIGSSHAEQDMVAALRGKDTESSASFSQKKELSSLIRQKTENHVGGQYYVDTNDALPNLTSTFARAYMVHDKKRKMEDAYYCLVLDKTIPWRLSAINTLKTFSDLTLNTPVACDVTFLTSFQEHFCVVVLPLPERRRISLAQYMKETGACTEEFLVEKIITPLNAMLGELEAIGVTHGNINLENVFFDENLNISVRECVSEPCGFSQKMVYEPIERGCALPIAKGEGDSSADYYALGVLAVFMLSGRNTVEEMDDEEILRAKMVKGSFNTLVGNQPLSPYMLDLCRGLLNDKKGTRWHHIQLSEWVKGKRFNLVRVPPIVEATRSLHFNGQQYFNRRAFAHDLFRYWDSAKKFLREDKLIKWVEGSVGDPDMADKLRKADKITMKKGLSIRTTFDEDDELVTRTTLILDPEGPMRIKDISTNIDGIAPLLAYAYSTHKRDYIQLIGYLISYNFLEYHKPPPGEKKSKNEYLWHLKRCMNFLSKKGFGFGMERCLYEINPFLPCQSPLVIKEAPISLPELLEILDSKTTIKDYPFDRHIAAFIANRIDLNNEIRVKTLEKFPEFAGNKHIQALALLMLAQKETGAKLRTLSEALANQMLSATSILHGKTIKKELHSNIRKVAKDGNLIKLFQIIADSQYIMQDMIGYQEAIEEYQEIGQEISKLDSKSTVSSLGYRYGLRLAVVISYFFCSIEILLLMMRTM